MKSSVACCGNGFVGGALTTVMNERGVDVYAYDKAGWYVAGAKACVRDERRGGDHQPSYRWPENVKELVENSESKSGFLGIFFVCLPTPMREDGSCDLSIVEGVLLELAELPGERIAVVKSTVPPGSTEKWNKRFEGMGLKIVHCPEFLREASAISDMRNQDRIIVGGPKDAVQKVRQLFSMTFPDVKFVATSSTNSELTKYVTNCFLAMKVSFANELYQIVEKLHAHGIDVDYNRVVECATLDKRLGTSHWQVPSFETDDEGKPLCGYGLSCFPKDVNALISKAKELGVKPIMLEATERKNIEVRPGKDWEKLIGRAVSEKKTNR